MLPASAQTYGISTFAGSPLPAQGAPFGLPLIPRSIATDPNGVLYIGDYAAVYKLSGGNLIRIAGTGISGFAGDGGPATSARLYQLFGLAVASNGDVYISDSSNNRVRKVTAATGVISTIAGNGAPKFAGDNGPAVGASLNFPSALKLDNAGNLYIADSNNNAIRKVNLSTNIITTVAGTGAGFNSGSGLGDGGVATMAQLNLPNGVALDNAGNLYIADTLNNLIRKVAVGTNIISTFAGPAGLNNPWGLAFDANQNLIFADDANNRLAKIASGGGTISTIAGNGTAGYSGDGGPATAAALNGPLLVAIDNAGNIFTNEYYNFAVRQINGSTGVISTIAGNGTAGDGGPATSAFLASPAQTATDGLGDLFIPDLTRVRKVDTAGVITAVAGSTKPGFGGDNGPGTAALLGAAGGVATDGAGNVYIADVTNNRIRKLTVSTGVITTIGGNGMAAFSGDGGPATSASFNQPLGVAVDAQGNVYVADTYNHRVRKIAAGSMTVTTIAGNGQQGFSGDGGTGTGASLSYPESVALDSTGDLYIADTYNSRIRKLVLSSGVITTFAGTLSGFSGDGATATAAALSYPSGVAVDTSGNVYIADTSNQRVRKVGTNGIITTIAGTGSPDFSGDGGPATAATLNFPTGVSIDRLGRIFVSDANNSRIRALSPAPFGVMDTPADHATGVSGAVSVTGWALAAAGVSSVGLYRDPVQGEPAGANGLVYLGPTSLVPGARPDIAGAYPGYPNGNAGWGAQVLTNELPGGNGTFKIHAIATDNNGLTTDIGAHTITVDNTHSALPFGTVDTPANGATASGASYVNFGWALTPQPNMIPVDGSTITVFIDNKVAGHPTYNQARADIQTIFPGYKNTNGAVGFFMIDTTKLTNGLHTISWVVSDNAGNAQGIGSRYFNVQN